MTVQELSRLSRILAAFVNSRLRNQRARSVSDLRTDLSGDSVSWIPRSSSPSLLTSSSSSFSRRSLSSRRPFFFGSPSHLTGARLTSDVNLNVKGSTVNSLPSDFYYLVERVFIRVRRINARARPEGLYLQSEMMWLVVACNTVYIVCQLKKVLLFFYWLFLRLL